MQNKDTLPFGSEFSPSQIELPVLLELAHDNEGDNQALQQEILKKFFIRHGRGNEKNKRTLAMNCRLGMKAYGIIDENGSLTEFGKELYNARSDKYLLYQILAKHILLNLHGMSLIQCIRDMEVSGTQVTLETLPAHLADRGIHYPSGGKHPSIMRLWLSLAGVFIGNRWVIDEDRVSSILGTDKEEFQVLESLNPEQRAFLVTLANLDTKSPVMANEVVKLASLTYGVKFPEKKLPKAVLNALVDAGYIIAEKTTAGRGAKPFIVHCTNKLNCEVIEPLLKQLKKQTDSKLFALIRKPLNEILTNLSSKNKYVAGLALEALAFKMMRLLDIKYVATRLRAQATGGAEVDLVFESTRLVYSRWQVQCKNTSRVALDDVAKEVGLTHFLKSNVIVIISTGDIGSEARRYANKIMRDSNLCIVMIDEYDIAKIKNMPSTIVDVFNREARHAMKLKAIEI